MIIMEKGLQINHEGLMGKLTMNLGVVKYVKEDADIELDLRCPHEIDLKKMCDSVKEIMSVSWIKFRK